MPDCVACKPKRFTTVPDKLTPDTVITPSFISAVPPAAAISENTVLNVAVLL